jgi:integrating conjugative element protein (TIGR03752 family)
MRTNKIVWVGLGVLTILAVVVVVNKGNEPAPANTVAENMTDANKKVTVKTVEGDTVVETLSQVQARYEAQVEENKKLREKNTEIEQRLSSLEYKTGNSKGDNRIDSVMTKLETLGGSLQNLSSQVQNQADQLGLAKSNGYSFSEEDLGWEGASSGYATSPSRPGRKNEPVYKRLAGYVSIPTLSSAMPEVTDPLKDTARSALSKKPAVPTETVTPHYTIPARSTLLDNVAMTALIGIVPVDGKLKDPFPVKIIVGNENLATNGLKIPGLKGAVFEGIAAGNWNLSCISVSLTAGTFTFTDGRVQHLKGKAQGERNAVASLTPITDGEVRNSIGYISDRQGVPCIAGQRVTDAHKQLATVGVLGLASNYFDARSEAEITRTSNASGDGTARLTGDAMKFAANKSVGKSLDDVTEFYLRRNRDTFDAIVAPPGLPVALHITTDLHVDYHSNSRKIAYSHSDRGDAHAHATLD